MAYSSRAATSIDLFVSEIVAHSRFRNVVIAEFSEPRLAAERVVDLPLYGFANSLRRAGFVARAVREIDPAVLVVQQHLPTAAAIAARVSCPVVMQKHNFIKAPKTGSLLGRLGKARHVRQFNALAGLTLVSETVKADFEAHWPEVSVPRRVVPNGIDTALWQPAAVREKTVLVVGRAAPEKGTLEAAEALAVALAQHPDWTATFVMSDPKRFKDYFDKVMAALAPLGPRAVVKLSVPFAEVKLANERAAIALIPSKWHEPFGRTCLEAHAGGAAVISSGSGGLREISGAEAVFLPAVEIGAIAQTVDALIRDEALRERLAAGQTGYGNDNAKESDQSERNIAHSVKTSEVAFVHDRPGPRSVTLQALFRTHPLGSILSRGLSG